MNLFQKVFYRTYILKSIIGHYDNTNDRGFFSVSRKETAGVSLPLLKEYKTEEAAIWVEKVSGANALHYSRKSTEVPCGERRKVE